jgi:hypothetical protein
MSLSKPPRQRSLFFDGDTYDPGQDRDRLARQLTAVRALMHDGQWHTLREIADKIGAPEASVSARLRDLRKTRFGAWIVDRQRVTDGHGLFRYRMRAPDPEDTGAP